MKFVQKYAVVHRNVTLHRLKHY
ncbi:hypothetical protein BLA29_014563 [Euroglyphus maynei]|uniref:Uncharacterized protein n=1 Tax=Euroglyphus maynei TaxID=6958 RepID=A0A1Y3BKS1_EURMA|nr:hypothetical protein BLA29_014563 [Euroglyphus maynei]